MSNKKTWVDPLLRPVAVGTIPPGGLDMTVTPTDAERAALVKALNLAAIDRLTATFRLKHRSGGMVDVTGELVGEVQPVCIMSLEAFPLKVREPVEMHFAPPELAVQAPEDVLSEDDPPDVMENGIIDLGKVTTEFLSLAIPAFPRKPGAAFKDAEEKAVESPFSALSVLKAKDSG